MEKKNKMKSFEKSALDKKIDKITAFKENSKKDKALDKVVMKAVEKKKK